MNVDHKAMNKIQWLKSENQRINGEITSFKKKQVELERKLKDLTEYHGTKKSQLFSLKKRCEESKLRLMELASDEKRIAAIRELENIRHSKIRQAIEDHKELLSRLTQRKIAETQSPRILGQEMNSPNPQVYINFNREYQLGEKERQLDDLKRLLEKREQDIVIKKNHIAARIIRLRKLLQSNEAKRTLLKEQLVALKAKTNRRY